MSARFIGHAVPTTMCLAAMLVGCGSATPSSPSPAKPRTTGTAAPKAAPLPGGTSNKALTIALTPAELPAALSSFKQSADGLMANTPNTDLRVFTSTDGTVMVQVFLAADTSGAAATIDYPAYNSAAQNRVTTLVGSSRPTVGTQANEYIGMDAGGNSVVALAFVEGSVDAVVIIASSTAVDPAVVETLARTQAQKVSTAGL